MAVKRNKLIRDYAKAIREGNAAIFGGAGLSRPSGYVDWKELLRPLATDIGLNIDKENDLLKVAQFCQNKNGRPCINRAIQEAFSKDLKINTNIKILSHLPIFTYWTTNYDELLEKGIREANRNPDVKSESAQLSNMKPDRDAIVYKMHGDVNNPAQAVLTKADYELYEYRRPLFRTALKGDLVSKVFLFIGFSFEDPNLDYILSQIHSLLGENVPSHYCFFKRVQRNEFTNDEEFGYQRAKQDMQENNLCKYGIQTVFVDSYDEITDILLDIEKETKLRNVFISGSAHVYNEPWDTQKAEDLARELAGALVKEDCRITSGFGLGIGSSIINGALEVIYAKKFRHIDEHLCLRPFPQNISNPDARASRWREYRESMISETGISIFMFGNKYDQNTKCVDIADGCMDEFKISKKNNNIIIPIGSTGYAAYNIWKEVKENISEYPYLSEFIDRLGSEKDINQIVLTVLDIVRKQQTGQS